MPARARVAGAARALVAALALPAAAGAIVAPVAAQLAYLPPTAVGANLPTGVGYALLNVGDDGPYIIRSLRVGKAAGAPTAPGTELLGPNDALLLVRDAKGAPAFRALADAKTAVPVMKVRTYNREITFTNVSVESAAPAAGSPADGAVPVVAARIHFDAVSEGRLVPATPAPTPTPTATPTLVPR